MSVRGIVSRVARKGAHRVLERPLSDFIHTPLGIHDSALDRDGGGGCLLEQGVASMEGEALVNGTYTYGMRSHL
jgi:hypothetical protein